MGIENPLSKEIIGAAIEVHKQLGPGLLESAYEECLNAWLMNSRYAASNKPLRA